jgi:4-hydroxy-3-methylbut-2-enyl diphosphate reductase
MKEAIVLGDFITGKRPAIEFYSTFEGRYSEGFDASKDLNRIGVVNQTTQLATDTQAISDYLKKTIATHYQLTEENIEERFADTRDTLCYATNDNQTAVTGMLETQADLAIVIGGYNSSNTTHLVELFDPILPTYFISSDDKLITKNTVVHFDYHSKQELTSSDYLPLKQPVTILMTSGASCPDAIVENVIRKLAAFYNVEERVETLIQNFNA